MSSTTTMSSTEEAQRETSLLDAQTKAAALFSEIEQTLIRPGILESELSKQIHELGEKRHGVRTHWHKRVVRSGPNTLQPYAENPPDRKIEEDDILFIDLGPVFEAWEADFGRTFVLGNDPVKKKLRDSLEPVWRKGKERFDADEGVTGQQLYRYVCDLAKEEGWEFGNVHAGHIVGDFPHERIPDDKVSLYITEGNEAPMRHLDKKGHKRQWILEVHLVDRERRIGAFMEQLLSVG